MGRLFHCIAFALVLANTPAIAPVRAAEPVDLLLVLAADVSRSVDSQKFQLQREGYAAAMANSRVVDAIRSGRHGRIGVLFLEWSGFGSQKVVIDWMIIDAAVGELARAPFTADRRTIDVSGDGTNNAGRDIGQARDEALALDITINGMVILSETPLPWNPEHTNPPGGLANYYRDNVIGGPGSFVLEAKDFNSFGQAIIKKMIAEIADARP